MEKAESQLITYLTRQDFVSLMAKETLKEGYEGEQSSS